MIKYFAAPSLLETSTSHTTEKESFYKNKKQIISISTMNNEVEHFKC